MNYESDRTGASPKGGLEIKEGCIEPLEFLDQE
jgi:hypothetical protein